MDQTYARLVAQRIKKKIKETKTKIKETKKVVESVDNSEKTPNKASFLKTFITATTLGVTSLVPGSAEGKTVQRDDNQPTPIENVGKSTLANNPFNNSPTQKNSLLNSNEADTSDIKLPDGRIFVRNFSSIDPSATIHLNGIKLCNDDFDGVPEEQVMTDMVSYASKHYGQEGGCTAFIKRKVIQISSVKNHIVDRQGWDRIVRGEDFEKWVDNGGFKGFSVCSISPKDLTNAACITIYRRAARNKPGKDGHCGIQEKDHGFIGENPKELGLPQKCVVGTSYPSACTILPTQTLIYGIENHQRNNPTQQMFIIKDTNGHYTIYDKLDENTMELIAQAQVEQKEILQHNNTIAIGHETFDNKGDSTLQIDNFAQIPTTPTRARQSFTPQRPEKRSDRNFATDPKERKAVLRRIITQKNRQS